MSLTCCNPFACPPRPPISRRSSQARLHWSAETDGAIEQRVADILADVRERGDEAVLEYTARFDGPECRQPAWPIWS